MTSSMHPPSFSGAERSGHSHGAESGAEAHAASSVLFLCFACSRVHAGGRGAAVPATASGRAKGSGSTVS